MSVNKKPKSIKPLTNITLPAKEERIFLEYADPEEEIPIWQSEYLFDSTKFDYALVFLAILEGGKEKFVKFGYTKGFETMKKYEFPYSGEIIMFVENIHFSRIIEFEKSDPIFKSNSNLSLLSYTPHEKLRISIPRCYTLNSIPIFRKFFKKLDGWELRDFNLYNLKENFSTDSCRYNLHIDSPKERKENRKYDIDYDFTPAFGSCDDNPDEEDTIMKSLEKGEGEKIGY